MNRMEEFALLQQELEQPVPELEGTVQRALRKRRRKRMIAGPLTSIAAVFAVFVALVNFSTPVAMACSKVPVLRELAEFVQFSQSLSQAVENDYVQPMDLIQSNGTVTAKVEYLIVDQKQINVYFRLSAPDYSELDAKFDLLMANGEDAHYVAWSSRQPEMPDNMLRSVVFDFVDEGDVPDTLRLIMEVFGSNDLKSAEDTLIGTFEFLMEFDPTFTEKGKILPVGKTVELDGQSITVENLEVYPTHIKVNLTEDPNNTAWLRDLEFYIQTRDGTQSFRAKGGFVALGANNSRSNLTYWADSTWFRSTRGLKLYITDAVWLEKDAPQVHVNMKQGTAKNLPPNITLESCVWDDDGYWQVTFRAPHKKVGESYNMFDMSAYDMEGNSYRINEWGVNTNEEESFTQTLFLKDYPYDEVWFRPDSTHIWHAEKAIKVKVS